MRYGRRKLTQICGARNRRGLPCQCKMLFKGGRCKYHGGLSTGPKTPEGWANAIKARMAGWQRWRQQKLAEAST